MWNRGEGEEAARLWERSFDLDRDDVFSADRLMAYHLGRGEKKKARAWAERALERAARHPYALFVLGNLALRQRMYGEAELMFREALYSSPIYPEARANLAQTLLLQGRPKEALEVLKPALERDPDQVEILILAHLSYKKAGDEKRAQQYYDRVKELAPDHPFIKERGQGK